ncbi:hypothetical protein BJ912DRAFT_1059916 [Pholiota molesta]|nr:hypothetical protein BJ912DRAFT_1059916 [Pholiota molesta]
MSLKLQKGTILQSASIFGNEGAVVADSTGSGFEPRLDDSEGSSPSPGPDSSYIRRLSSESMAVDAVPNEDAAVHEFTGGPVNDPSYIHYQPFSPRDESTWSSSNPVPFERVEESIKYPHAAVDSQTISSY